MTEPTRSNFHVQTSTRNTTGLHVCCCFLITEAIWPTTSVHRGCACADKASEVKYTGSDPVYRTQYKVATAGSASLGALAIAMADIRDSSSSSVVAATSFARTLRRALNSSN